MRLKQDYFARKGEDIILMVDEMFLQKSTQYQGSEYVGTNEDGNLYKGVIGGLHDSWL